MSNLPLINAIEKMAIVDKEPRSALLFAGNTEKCQIQAKDFHLGNPTAPVSLNCNPELWAAIRCLDNKLAYPVLI